MQKLKTQVTRLKKHNLDTIFDIALDYLYAVEESKKADKLSHSKIVSNATKIANKVYNELLENNLSSIIDKIVHL